MRHFSRRWRTWLMQPVSADQRALLEAIWQGAVLRSHRDLDGNKQYRLHSPDNTVALVPPALVQGLRHQRLIETNHKFPADTWLLTEIGRNAINADPAPGHPLTTRNFVRP
jgi:hypothetical protein